jgi:fumiquinazoline A oxidase
VGLVGLTLGGGIGTLQGKHGLVMDSLLSVRMVTATGEIITASKAENPDLFWALRGAGANFGIVISATYKVHDATNNGRFVSADFEYSEASSCELWELLKSFDDDMPLELSIVLGCGYNRTKAQVSPKVS